MGRQRSGDRTVVLRPAWKGQDSRDRLLDWSAGQRAATVKEALLLVAKFTPRVVHDPAREVLRTKAFAPERPHSIFMGRNGLLSEAVTRTCGRCRKQAEARRVQTWFG